MHKNENDKEDRERKNRLVVCLSEDEKRLFEAKYKLSGLHSHSDFIRQLIIHGNIYSVDLIPLKNAEVAVNRIGNNINQIAKKMNESGRVYIEDVKQIQMYQKKLIKLITDAYEATNI